MIEEQLRPSSRRRCYSKVRTFTALLAKELKIATSTDVEAFFKRDLSGLMRTINRFSYDENSHGKLNELKQFVFKSP